MARGIIIFGSAGSGKTSLGKLVAKKLDYPYYDIDDYIWRQDTDKPFTIMYSKKDKISRLMKDITRSNNFVMAGSMDSFNGPFVPLFDLAIHITASIPIRLKRINERERERFGDRILEGGDLFESHQRFLKISSSYDTDGSPSMKVHEEWAKILPCKVIRLDGEDSLLTNAEKIIEVYKAL